MFEFVLSVGDMPSSRDTVRAERNGRFKSRRRDSGNSEGNRHNFEVSDKRHRKHGKSKSSGRKKKKRSRDKSLESPTKVASSLKPLVEYSDVSSEDLSEPEAGEIQSEDSRGNSYTDGEVPESLLQRRYYGGVSPRANLGASPISASPTSPTQQHRLLAKHYPLGEEQQPSQLTMIRKSPEFSEDTRRYGKRKEKKHKREKKKKRSLSPFSNTTKKKKRKSKRHSRSASPSRVIGDIDSVSPEHMKGTASWTKSPPLPLKDNTSPISPATPQDNRVLSDMDLDSPVREVRNAPSPSPTVPQSPHTPLLPPRPQSPDSNKMNHGMKHSPDRQKHSPIGHIRRNNSDSPIHGSSRKRPHSPSPIPRRRDHSPPRRRDFSPNAMSRMRHSPAPMPRMRHSPSPSSLRRREYSTSPLRHRRRDMQGGGGGTSGMGTGPGSPSSKRRRREEPDRRHKHHDKERREKRKSASIRSPIPSRLPMPLSRSRSRSPGRWRKVQSRSRSRSRRRSRTPKKSRSPSKSHKSSRKHKSKSPRPSRIPSPSPHRSRAKSPSSITAKNLRVQAKISETSLFAELVKNRNMRELAMKKLQAANEKANNQDDVQIIEGVDEKDSLENKETDKSGISPNKNQQNVQIQDIPVPTLSLTVDDIPIAAKTPPLPAHMPKLMVASPQYSPNSFSGTGSNSETPVHNNLTSVPPPPPTGSQGPPLPSALPPLPQSETAKVPAQLPNVVPIPVPAPVPVTIHNPVPTPSPIAVLPNLSVPPPPLPIPVPAPNSAIAKFNTPNNLVQIKSNDPPKPPIVAFKTKSLSRLPLPPGINQNDLESIDSPPSRSPTPPPKIKLSHTPSGKSTTRKSIKDLPMPPG